MGVKNIHNKGLSIQQAIKVASRFKDTEKTRVTLVEVISEPTYQSLCRLGLITEGATVDANNNRQAVWKFTDRVQLYRRIEKPELTPGKQRIASALGKMGF